MGTYNIGIEEFEEKFEEFLNGLEGDIDAETLIEAWNNLVKKYNWGRNEKIRLSYEKKI